MWRAAAEGDAQAVAAWLNEEGGVDACTARHGVTLLMVAAGAGQEAVVRMLLQHGASVNLMCPPGGSALIAAAANGHITIVQVLLDAKADASLQTTNGNTALMAAEEEQETATANLLRQYVKRQTTEAEARTASTVPHATAA